MAKITLSGLKHSYMPTPAAPEDWALKELNLDWEDGGAYALLGPSGCGKTTLLNIISGLLQPSNGQVLFDGKDVTTLSPQARRIAQVFQFPVVYDTMTVFNNLAFPLRNRGVPEAEVKARVELIAEMTDLTAMLHKRAAGLTADGKQKISLGRGLVREDVNAILFDEPLTVIDPHLKFQLRSKLKELHHRVPRTMIYVTHDQTEALTFADRVLVMNEGQMVQAGTPEELFLTPNHTFVGHFIGSPGMNVIPCDIDGNGRAVLEGHVVPSANTVLAGASGRFEIGIRPEFIGIVGSGQNDIGLPATVTKLSDAGRFRIAEAICLGQGLKFLVPEDHPIPAGEVRLGFDPTRTNIYHNGWLAGHEGGS